MFENKKFKVTKILAKADKEHPYVQEGYSENETSVCILKHADTHHLYTDRIRTSPVKCIAFNDDGSFTVETLNSNYRIEPVSESDKG